MYYVLAFLRLICVLFQNPFDSFFGEKSSHLKTTSKRTHIHHDSNSHVESVSLLSWPNCPIIIILYSNTNPNEYDYECKYKCGGNTNEPYARVRMPKHPTPKQRFHVTIIKAAAESTNKLKSTSLPVGSLYMIRHGFGCSLV